MKTANGRSTVKAGGRTCSHPRVPETALLRRTSGRTRPERKGSRSPSNRSTYDQLNRDGTARSQGTQRAQDYNSWKSSGSTRAGAEATAEGAAEAAGAVDGTSVEET